MIRNERHALIIVGTSYKLAPAGELQRSNVTNVELNKILNDGSLLDKTKIYMMNGKGEFQLLNKESVISAFSSSCTK